MIVGPGAFFFPALKGSRTHKRQCLRISLTATQEDIERGVAAIARVVGRAYERRGFAER